MDLLSVPESAGKDVDPPRSYLRTEGFNSWNTGYYFNFVVLVLFLLLWWWCVCVVFVVVLCVLLLCWFVVVLLWWWCVCCCFVVLFLLYCYCCCLFVGLFIIMLDVLEAITMMIDQGSISWIESWFVWRKIINTTLITIDKWDPKLNVFINARDIFFFEY